MARKPFMTNTHTHFKVKAKNLKKKDRVSLLGFSAQIVSVHDNKDGTRGVVLRHANKMSSETILVIIPNKFKVTVTDHKFESRPENR